MTVLRRAIHRLGGLALRALHPVYRALTAVLARGWLHDYAGGQSTRRVIPWTDLYDTVRTLTPAPHHIAERAAVIAWQTAAEEGLLPLLPRSPRGPDGQDRWSLSWPEYRRAVRRLLARWSHASHPDTDIPGWAEIARHRYALGEPVGLAVEAVRSHYYV